jgi:hypothetical protein
LRCSVEPRSRPKIAAPSVEASTAPSSRPSSVDRSNSHAAGDDRGRDRADHGEGDRRRQDRADLEQAGRQAALEQDHRQRDDADRARELVVVEVDPAGAVRADRHADAEEQQQARHPHPARQQRGQQAGGQQRSRDEDELAVVHGNEGTLSGDACKRRCMV